MRESAIFYRSFYEAIKELPAENKAEVYEAVFEYALNLNEVELSGIGKTIFTLIKPQIDANIRRFKNGSKAKQKRNVSKPKANNNVNNKGNLNDKENLNNNLNLNKTKTENLNDNLKSKENGNENDNALVSSPPFCEIYSFEEFWNLYNKKVDRTTCEDKWNKLTAQEQHAIMQHLPGYITATPDLFYRKYPATYIDRRVWEDEHLPSFPKPKSKSAFEMLIETGKYE